MKNYIFIAATAIIISMTSCTNDDNEAQTKQSFEINSLDNTETNLKEGDTLFEGDPNPPKPKG